MGLHRINANPDRACPPPLAGAPTAWDESEIGAGGSGVEGTQYASISQTGLTDHLSRGEQVMDVKPFRVGGDETMYMDPMYNFEASTS
eukprot:3758220-Pyramimonas_sp.AAC.1